MAFSGNLQEIPLVDVIQLLHGTRKSGILNIIGNKGKSQLIFKGGFIVGANHLDNSVRIGEFMVERGDITAEALDQSLTVQQQSVKKRQPLIVTLVALGLVDEHKAYTALQSLISMTIVEVLTWQSGSFLLEPSREVIKDDFKFYPDSLEKEINIGVQGALMDALRVYDEKVRDGELMSEEGPGGDGLDEIAADLLGFSDAEEGSGGVKMDFFEGITATDLGLADIDEQ